MQQKIIIGAKCTLNFGEDATKEILRICTVVSIDGNTYTAIADGLGWKMSGIPIDKFHPTLENMLEIQKLQHHKDVTVGLWALNIDPRNLLYEFWQRISDACPLEAGEAENEESEFWIFVDKLCFQIK